MAEPVRRDGVEGESAVDWAELRRRIEAASAWLFEDARSPDRAEAVLEARARQLAAEESAPTHPSLEVLLFELGGEVYAIAAEYVVGVFPLQCLTPVPGSNPLVSGITEWRGELLTIVDLRPLLDLPATDLDDLSMTVVLGSNQARFGVLADVVRGFSELAKPEPDGPGAKRRLHKHIRALTPEAVVLLDGESLLSDELTRDI